VVRLKALTLLAPPRDDGEPRRAAVGPLQLDPRDVPAKLVGRARRRLEGDLEVCRFQRIEQRRDVQQVDLAQRHHRAC